MKQLTTDEAIALHDCGEWKGWSHMQRASFQLIQNKLCMPFSTFHESVEKALGRPVWTHEFGLNRDGLVQELAGLVDAPTMEEIVALIPAEKLILVNRDQ